MLCQEWTFQGYSALSSNLDINYGLCVFYLLKLCTPEFEHQETSQRHKAACGLDINKKT